MLPTKKRLPCAPSTRSNGTTNLSFGPVQLSDSVLVRSLFPLCFCKRAAKRRAGGIGIEQLSSSI